MCKTKFILILAFLTGGYFFSLGQPLSGNYTIGGTTPSYTTLNDAVTDLNSKGISGPVVFSIRPGTYTERVTINQISGASVTNTITFQGAGIDMTTIANNGTNTTNWANFLLNGTDYLTLRDMTIATTISTGNYGVGVLLYNDADHNQLTNLKITGKVAAQLNIALVVVSGTANSVVSNGSATGSYNKIDSCQFIGGFRAIRFLGINNTSAAANYKAGNDVTNCTFTNINAECLTYVGQQDFVVKNNTFGAIGQAAAGYAIQAEYCANFEFSGNSIMESGIRGIFLQNINTNTFIPNTGTRVFNNFVKTKAGHGLFVEQSKSIKFWHNNFLSTHLTQPVYASTVRFLTSTAMDFRNNHIQSSNPANGFYCLLADQASVFDLLDHNNYHSSSDNLAQVQGINYPTLAALKNAFPLFNTASLNRMPGYISETNLHLSKNVSSLPGMYVGIDKDFDGDSRISGSPVIGADEIVRHGNDAGIIAVTSPTGRFCNGYQKIKVLLVNTGSNVLDSLTLQWTRDGNRQPDIKVSLPLDVAGSINGNTREFLLDSFLFTTGTAQQFTIWTTAPNGQADPDHSNDTVSITPGASLNGTYSLGGTNAGFTSFTQLSAYLNTYGVCGPVTIRINPGIYNERLVLENVAGISAANPVKFIGSGTASTILWDTSTTTGTVSLRGAGFVTLRDMTIEAKGNTTGFAVIYKGDSSHFTNLLINLAGTAKTGLSFEGNHNLMDSITINNGTTGLTGSFASSHNTISNCILTGQTSYGIYPQYQSYFSIINNRINSLGAGMWCAFLDNYVVSGNTINARTYGYWDMGSTNTDNAYPSLVCNNMISCETSTAYYAYNTDKVKVWHNSFRSTPVNVPFLLSQVRSIAEFSNALNIDFRNNHLQNDNAAANSYVVVSTTATAFTAMDHNNYYGGGVLARIANTDHSNFAALRTAYPALNTASFSRDPFYVSKADLHIALFQPDMKGRYTGIDFDIDGEARCTATPDIGADESEYKQPQPLVIYIADSVFVNSPLLVFNNLAAEPLSFTWYIDGVVVSDSNMLTHNFAVAGAHTLSLQTYMGNANCNVSDSTGMLLTVYHPTHPPVADFYAPVTVAQKTFTDHLQLFDLSAHGPASWEWSVSGNAYFLPNEFAQHPRLWFAEPGYYDVCLTASNAAGQGNKTCKPLYLGALDNVALCSAGTTMSASYLGRITDDGGINGNYTANKACAFLIDPPCIKGPLTLTLNSFDLGATDVLNIYDGKDNKGNLLAALSGNTGPGAGVFSATGGSLFLEWRSSNNAPRAGFEAIWRSVPDTLPPAAVADFIFPDTVYTGKTTWFTSTSSGNKLSYQWDFDTFAGIQPGFNGGKRATDAFIWNTPGTYEVKLSVVSGCGSSDSVKKQVIVVNPSSSPLANFQALRRRIPVNTVITLQDLSGHAPDSWQWEITPATVTYSNGNTVQDAQVAFAAPGLYTVKLKVSNALGTDSTEKIAYIDVFDYCIPQVSRISPDMGISQVQYKNIDHKTSPGLLRYSNYYSFFQAPAAASNETFTVTVSRNTAGNPISRKIWIDWNQDGDFSDQGELVAFEISAKTLVFQAAVTVPASAKEGFTVMRIGTSYDNGTNEPCGTNQIGEFKDYPLQVVLPPVALPLVTLLGSSTDSVAVFGAYQDPGAVATDFLQVDITAAIVVKGLVNTAIPGDYIRWYVVTDNWGNSDSVSRKTTVYDPIAPQLLLIGADTLVTEVFSPINDPGVTAADNYYTNLTITADSAGVNTAVTGIYPLYYTVTDGSGNSVTGTRWIKVVDTQAPVLALAGKDTLLLDVFNAYTEAGVIVSDNYCAGTWQVSSNLDTSVLGTYTLVYSASDCEGNVGVPVTRTIKVVDRIAPVIVLNGNDLVDIRRWENYADGGFTLSDNYYPAAQITVDTLGNWLNSSEEGLYYIQYRAIDPSGNIALSAKRIIDVRGIGTGYESAHMTNLSLYPNPNNGNFTLDLDEAVTGTPVLTVFDLTGRAVYHTAVTEKLSTLQLDQLAAGMYQVIIEMNGKRTVIKTSIVR